MIFIFGFCWRSNILYLWEFFCIIRCFFSAHLYDSVKFLELWKHECCINARQTVIITCLDIIWLLCGREISLFAFDTTMGANQLEFLSDSFRIGDNNATFPCGDDLVLAEAEHRSITKSPYTFVVYFCPEWFCGILEKYEVMVFCDFL